MMIQIVIYGTGKNAEFFVKHLNRSNAEIVGVVERPESRKLGCEFCGCKVKTIDQVVFKDSTIMVICSDSWKTIIDRISKNEPKYKMLSFSYDVVPFDSKEELISSVFSKILYREALEIIEKRIEEKNERSRLRKLFDNVKNSTQTNDYPLSVYGDIFTHDQIMASLILESIVNIPQYELIINNCFGYKTFIDSGFSMKFITKYNFPCDCYPMLACIKKYIKTADIVFDVGANRGIVSCFFATMSRMVHSFEPSVEAGECAKRNIELNGFSNIVWNRVGVAERNGKRSFWECGIENSGHNSFYYQKEDAPQLSYDVSIVTLDDYCDANNIKEIDILKIDVEGYEPNVIEGAQKLLKNNSIKTIFFEISPAVDGDLDSFNEMVKIIKDYGYSYYDLNMKEITDEELANATCHMDVIALKDELPKV